jgi:hypothetical protein
MRLGNGRVCRRVDLTFEEAALVEFSLSRMDVTGNAFFNSTGHYGPVRTEEGWKIQSMFFVNPITVGTD